MPDEDVLAALLAEGLVARDGGRVRATRRWQAAMARAARRLALQDAPWKDLRLPIAAALLELRGDLPDEELARRVEALLPIEAAGSIELTASARDERAEPEREPEGGRDPAHL